MKDQSKTKQVLIQELASLKQRIAELEQAKPEPKQAEEELLLKNLIFEASITANSIADINGNLTHANSSFIRMWGYENKEEVIGKPIRDFLKFEYETRKIITALNENSEWTGEYTALKRDGTTFNAYSQATIVTDESGNNIGYQSTVLDITDRKQIEEALRESQAQYRTLVENASDIVFRTDNSGHFTFVNPAGIRITGYGEKELIGKHYPTLIRPDMRDEAIRFFGRQFVKGINNTYSEYPILTKDGHDVWLGQNTQLIVEDGHVTGFQAVSRDITDRKRAEDALRKSEAKYQFLAESMADVVFMLDMNLVPTYVSPSIEKMLGFTPEERITQKVDQQLTPKSQKLVREVLMAELEREKEKGEDTDWSHTLELDYYHKDGSIKHLVTYFRGMRDGEGNLTGFYGSHHDITDRKRAEERLRLITDNMSDMIRVTDLQGVNLYTSPSHFKGLGYTPEERAGKSAFDIVHPDDVEHVIKVFFDGLVNKKPAKLEYRIKHAEGHYVWLETVGDLLKDDRGEVTAVVTSSRDITERKRSEEMLKRSEEKFRFLTENMNDNIFTMNLNLQTTYVSQSIEKILGFTPEERMKQDVTEQVTPASMTLIEKILSEELEREEKGLGDPNRSIKFEVEYYHKDGSTVWMENVISGIRNDQGVAVGIHGVSRDITERKKSEHALKESLVRLHKSLGATVQAMAVTVETRDPYTAGHQRRVADLARSIAKEMNLSTDQIEGIRMASTIHDIGKISVPAEILSKPTKLTNIEFELIKTHAQSGYDILKDIDFPWPVARMVLEHHEKMNGSGYPNGSVGENILLESKILAVADVVEAMASNRPYRPSLGIDAAFKELEENKGTKYDAVAVEACLKLFREKGYQLKGA